MRYKYNEVGENIRKRREHLSMTQEELSEAAHINRNTLSKLENGEIEYSEIKLGQFMRLLNALDVDMSYILGGENEHIENKEVSEITGLSNKSIEVLRKISANPRPTLTDANGLIVSTGENANELSRAIDFINYALEEYSDRCKRDDSQLNELIFIYLHKCISASDAYCVTDRAQIDPFMETVLNHHDDLFFFNENTRKMDICPASDLYRTHNMNIVNWWLNSHARKHDKKSLMG